MANINITIMIYTLISYFKIENVNEMKLIIKIY